MPVEESLGLAVGQCAAGETFHEAPEELGGSFQFKCNREAAGAVDAHDEACRLAGRAADGQPLACGKLLGPVEQDEAGGFHLAEFVGEPILFFHAAFGLQAEDDGLKSACLEAGDELLDERGFSRAVATDDARAPIQFLDPFEQGFPTHALRETERDAFEMACGKWILAGDHWDAINRESGASQGMTNGNDE